VRVLGKLIVAKGLKNLPKVEKIAQSGHTGHLAQSVTSKKLPKMISIEKLNILTPLQELH